MGGDFESAGGGRLFPSKPPDSASSQDGVELAHATIASGQGFGPAHALAKALLDMREHIEELQHTANPTNSGPQGAVMMKKPSAIAADLADKIAALYRGTQPAGGEVASMIDAVIDQAVLGALAAAKEED